MVVCCACVFSGPTGDGGCAELPIHMRSQRRLLPLIILLYAIHCHPLRVPAATPNIVVDHV